MSKPEVRFNTINNEEIIEWDNSGDMELFQTREKVYVFGENGCIAEFPTELAKQVAKLMYRFFFED